MKSEILFGIAWSLFVSLLSVFFYSWLDISSMGMVFKIVIYFLFVWLVFFVWAYPIHIFQQRARLHRSSTKTLTDDQIEALIQKSANITKDLLFAYIAETEIRIHVLETVLLQKGIIVSTEEILNQQDSQGKKLFEGYIAGFDQLLQINHDRMREIRQKQAS